jgi:hypothetical protein
VQYLKLIKLTVLPVFKLTLASITTVGRKELGVKILVNDGRLEILFDDDIVNTAV